MKNFKVEKVFIDQTEFFKQLTVLFKGPKLDVEIDFRHENKVYITDIYSKTASKAKNLAQMLASQNVHFEHEFGEMISNLSMTDISIKLLLALYNIDPEGNSYIISPIIHGETTFSAKAEVATRR